MAETVGPVTPERVEKAGEVARKLGMNLPEPQSWGVLENIPSVNQSLTSIIF
jgi:hypothetical protein